MPIRQPVIVSKRATCYFSRLSVLNKQFILTRTHVISPDPAQFSSIPHVMLRLIDAFLIIGFLAHVYKVHYHVTNISRQWAHLEKTHLVTNVCYVLWVNCL